ncbi:MAG: hypothetical protein IK099_10060 [Clostridia bacterium]|nr:hypothetical protein [Clostridia bacterium]
MKKTLALILTLCMAFSLFTAYAEETQVPVETETNTEADVSENQPEPNAEPETEPESEPEESLDALLGRLLSGDESSAENAVLNLLGGLGIDTAGYEEKINKTVGEVKDAVGELVKSAKEEASGWLSQLGEGMNTLLGELDKSLEQTKTSAASQIEELRALLEKLINEAKEQDAGSDLVKALTELLETAKGIAEDDIEAVTEVFSKLVEIILNHIQ